MVMVVVVVVVKMVSMVILASKFIIDEDFQFQKKEELRRDQIAG